MDLYWYELMEYWVIEQSWDVDCFFVLYDEGIVCYLGYFLFYFVVVCYFVLKWGGDLVGLEVYVCRVMVVVLLQD